MQLEHSDEHKKLGLNIAYYRKEKKMLHMQLAKEISISRTHMTRI